MTDKTLNKDEISYGEIDKILNLFYLKKNILAKFYNPKNIDVTSIVQHREIILNHFDIYRGVHTTNLLGGFVKEKKIFDIYKTVQIEERLLEITPEKKLIIHPWKKVSIVEEKIDTEFRYP